ncbi:MAG: hypothetical protein NT090_05695, partial [Acidobacteria bacterium]|nr:hypothetical protein [Acidobacteriota bacterium]
MKAPIRVLLALAAASAAVSVVAQSEDGPEISGSVIGSAAYRELRNRAFYPDVDAELSDYAAFTTAGIAVEAGDRSRLSFEARCRIDAVDRSLSFEILRAYAEAKMGDYLAIGLGRRIAGFGCGLIWNPVNGVDTPRNPFNRNASRPGMDAAFASLDLGKATGFPLSLSVQAFPPPFEAGIDIAELTVAAQTYLYIGGVELGFVGDCADPAGDRPRWSAGAWGTVDLAGLVLGFETAWRKTDMIPRPDAGGLPVADADPHLSALVTASFQIGDFFIYAEGLYSGAGLSMAEAQRVSSAPAAVLPAYAFITTPGSIGEWHAAAGFEWARGEWACGVGALWDIEE